MFGEDGHGYCKTYGTGVPRSLVYQKDTSSSDAPNPAFIEKICHAVCEKLEPQIKAEFDKIHARIGLLESQADSVGGSRVNANQVVYKKCYIFIWPTLNYMYAIF